MRFVDDEKNIVLAGLMSLMIGMSASASSVTGDVKQIIVGGNGVVYLVIDGYPSTGCSATNKRYVIDTTTKSGEDMYAMALSAYHAKEQITVIGNDSCAWPSQDDAEGILNTSVTR